MMYQMGKMFSVKGAVMKYYVKYDPQPTPQQIQHHLKTKLVNDLIKQQQRIKEQLNVTIHPSNNRTSGVPFTTV